MNTHLDLIDFGEKIVDATQFARELILIEIMDTSGEDKDPQNNHAPKHMLVVNLSQSQKQKQSKTLFKGQLETLRHRSHSTAMVNTCKEIHL